jgi:hypothetical protein
MKLFRWLKIVFLTAFDDLECAFVKMGWWWVLPSRGVFSAVRSPQFLASVLRGLHFGAELLHLAAFPISIYFSSINFARNA